MGEVRKTIGDNIKMICAIKGIRQVDIAEHLRISQSSVSNWIKGTNSIDIEHLAELCSFLGVTLDQIYGISPLANDTSFAPDESALLMLYRALNAEGKKLLHTMAQQMSECNSLINDV